MAAATTKQQQLYDNFLIIIQINFDALVVIVVTTEPVLSAVCRSSDLVSHVSLKYCCFTAAVATRTVMDLSGYYCRCPCLLIRVVL